MQILQWLAPLEAAARRMILLEALASAETQRARAAILRRAPRLRVSPIIRYPCCRKTPRTGASTFMCFVCRKSGARKPRRARRLNTKYNTPRLHSRAGSRRCAA